MFQGNIEEQQECDYFTFHNNKVPLNTCNTLRHGQSLMSPNFNQPQGQSPALDLSLDQLLYHNNATFLKTSIVSYLKHCLQGSFPDADPFDNGQIFRFPSSCNLEADMDNQFELLVGGNSLLGEWNKKILTENFKEFPELNGLFGQLCGQVGVGITQELIYIAHMLLEDKLQPFRKILNSKQNEWLVPKFDRFCIEDEMDKELNTQFKTFEDIQIEDVNKFSSKDVEKIANNIYFSSQLKYLTLKETNMDIKNGVNVLDKFSSLVILVSRIVFLSMASMAIPDAQEQLFKGQLQIHSPEEGVAEGWATKKIKQ